MTVNESPANETSKPKPTVTHFFFQQGYTYSSNATPPNYVTPYVFMKNKYIQTSTERMDLFCYMVSECRVQCSFTYACQESIAEETLPHCHQEL